MFGTDSSSNPVKPEDCTEQFWDHLLLGKPYQGPVPQVCGAECGGSTGDQCSIRRWAAVGNKSARVLLATTLRLYHPRSAVPPGPALP
jgi:hypothetical protein